MQMALARSLVEVNLCCVPDVSDASQRIEPRRACQLLDEKPNCQMFCLRERPHGGHPFMKHESEQRPGR